MCFHSTILFMCLIVLLSYCQSNNVMEESIIERKMTSSPSANNIDNFQRKTSTEMIRKTTNAKKTSESVTTEAIAISSLKSGDSALSSTTETVSATSSSSETLALTSEAKTTVGKISAAITALTTRTEATTSSLNGNNSENVSETSNSAVKRFKLDPHDYLDKIVTPVTLVVGLFGNAATLFALQGHPFNKIPSQYVLAGLALTDSLALVTNSLGKKIVINMMGFDLRAYSDTSCKIFIFAAHFAKILSSWFVVLVCFERFVAICLPLHAKRICTKSNAVKGIVATLVMAITYSGIWTLSTAKVGSKCNSSYWTPETMVRGKAIILIGSLLIGVLPMAIMVTLTPVMCVVLRRNRLSRKAISSNRGKAVSKISAMLISICISYIVLLLPLIISYNMAFVRGENLFTTQYLPLMILAIVGVNFSAINYSCNFFLYLICNKAFRRRMFDACLLRKRKQESSTQRNSEAFPTLSTISG